MITKYTDDIPSIMVNTEKENVVWALTDENKIAIPKQEQVNAITKKSEINQQFDAKDYKTKEGLQELKKSMDLPVTDKKEKIKLSSKIYPNPCVNHVNIELNESHDCLVQLLDQTGRMVDNVSFTGENYRWNIDKHKEGNYILVVLIPSLQYKSSFKVLKK
jgi:hypothetical protein